MTSSELTLHIVLVKPVNGLDFGIQKGSGTQYETVQIQRSKSKDLHFEFTIQVKGDRRKDKIPGFSGPFVQGKPGSKFIYIDFGSYAGQVGGQNGRMKVPLTGITWSLISQLENKPKAILETHVPGSGADGGPAYATVKHFEGWTLRVI